MSDEAHQIHRSPQRERATARVTVERAPESARPLLARLLELNAHDFSEIDGRDVREDGEFGYLYLDRYWAEPEDRQALLLRCDDAIAGMAMVRRGPPHQVAEFFILRKFRRRGVGRQAARTYCAPGPGRGRPMRSLATTWQCRSGTMRFPSPTPRMPTTRAPPNAP